MIIWIGGESSTGKTYLAQRLLERHGMPYFSIDLLKMGIYYADPACGFSPEDDNSVIEEALWPLLKNMIEVSIGNGRNMIFEGCYLFPHRLAEFTPEDRARILPVYIGFSQSYIERNFETGILAHNSVIEQRDGEDRDAAWFMRAHADWKHLCARSNVPFFEIDGEYAQEIDTLLDRIDTELSKHKKSRRYL